MKTLITRNKWIAIVNLMDDEKRKQVVYDSCPCTVDEFLEKYLNLDPEFEDVLKLGFNIDIYKDAYDEYRRLGYRLK